MLGFEQDRRNTFTMKKIERHYVHMDKVIWKTEKKIIWIIKAKNANEVKEFFTI